MDHLIWHQNLEKQAEEEEKLHEADAEEKRLEEEKRKAEEEAKRQADYLVQCDEMAAKIKQEVKDPAVQLIIKKQKGKMTQMSIDLTGDIAWSDEEGETSQPQPRPPGATGSAASSKYHTPISSPASVNNIVTPGTSQTFHQHELSPTPETEDDRKNKRTLFVRNLPRDVTELQVNFSLK